MDKTNISNTRAMQVQNNMSKKPFLLFKIMFHCFE